MLSASTVEFRSFEFLEVEKRAGERPRERERERESDFSLFGNKENSRVYLVATVHFTGASSYVDNHAFHFFYC